MKIIADCSHYQAITNWSLGVDGVFLKATQGTSFIDPTYLKYRDSVRKNGLIFGSYHFAQGLDAKKEAQFFLKTVGEILEKEILILDFEIQLTDPVTWCKTFLDECYNIAGFRPLIYLNSSTEKTFDWSEVAKNYGLWLANYNVNDGKEHTFVPPVHWKAVAMHQYTSNGTVKNYSGRVDLSSAIDNITDYGKKIAPQAPIPVEPVSIPVIEQTPIIDAPSAPEAIVHDSEPIIPVSNISTTEKQITTDLVTDPNIQAMNQAEQDLTPWWEKLIQSLINLFLKK